MWVTAIVALREGGVFGFILAITNQVRWREGHW